MDRRTWLDERQAAVVATYDAASAAYDSHEYPTTSHRRFVTALLETCRPDGLVLDAPCGTGRYFGMIRTAGRRVVGIDQSSGMLAQARAKGIAAALAQVSLQGLTFAGQFDAVMTIDAMENVPPEDWPAVLANLRRALRVGGHLYMTVEEVDPGAIDDAFRALTAQGLPAVRGEMTEGDVAGYHYYPGRDQVLRWLATQRLDVVTEAFDQEDGWGYRHLLMRTR